MDDDLIALHQSSSDQERERYATTSENDTCSSNETTDADIDTDEIEVRKEIPYSGKSFAAENFRELLEVGFSR